MRRPVWPSSGTGRSQAVLWKSQRLPKRQPTGHAPGRGTEPRIVGKGGSPLAAALHLARTVARRAERITVELASVEPDTNPETVRYLNRLSDLLFVLARRANGNGERDVLWVPGANR